MARTATTADAFNAIAEVRRREILDALAEGERSVGELTRLLGIAQPQVSKHLRVLREVGVVDVREHGRQRLYHLNGQALKPIHDWISAYESFWSERFDALDAVLDDAIRDDAVRNEAIRDDVVRDDVVRDDRKDEQHADDARGAEGERGHGY
ncbi:ArsR/SmtB family transcription factor [Streptomyces iconiensis]|uniref:ArsR/SmtB family transcription factor n=1 Tax=Streptomyces iconiensis TaxID=1384038 RepID=UPI00321A8A93